MKRFWAGLVGFGAVIALAVPAVASTSSEGAHAAAAAACAGSKSAKRVTVSVKLDGDSPTKYTYKCSALRHSTPVSSRTPRTTSAPRTTTTTVDPEKFIPAPTDFALSVTETSKSCFGSAGCNVRFRIGVAYNGLVPLSPTREYLVTYRLDGGDALQTNSFTIRGSSVSVKSEELIQTPGPDVVITATPTSVLPN